MYFGRMMSEWGGTAGGEAFSAPITGVMKQGLGSLLWSAQALPNPLLAHHVRRGLVRLYPCGTIRESPTDSQLTAQNLASAV